jgi:RNA recognition motif-containing protein
VDLAGSAEAASATVFVGNLPWSATEEGLRGFFGDCGDIKSVRIGELRRQRMTLGPHP